jgi:hypothetical protein
MNDAPEEKLYKKVQSAFPSHLPLAYDQTYFSQVRKIVNAIKHEVGGAHPDQREIPDLPFDAVAWLIALLKADPILQQLKDRFKDYKVPITGKKKV